MKFKWQVLCWRFGTCNTWISDVGNSCTNKVIKVCSEFNLICVMRATWSLDNVIHLVIEFNCKIFVPKPRKIKMLLVCCAGGVQTCLCLCLACIAKVWNFSAKVQNYVHGSEFQSKGSLFKANIQTAALAFFLTFPWNSESSHRWLRPYTSNTETTVFAIISSFIQGLSLKLWKNFEGVLTLWKKTYCSQNDLVNGQKQIISCHEYQN